MNNSYSTIILDKLYNTILSGSFLEDKDLVEEYLFNDEGFTVSLNEYLFSTLEGNDKGYKTIKKSFQKNLLRVVHDILKDEMCSKYHLSDDSFEDYLTMLNHNIDIDSLLKDKINPTLRGDLF